MSSISEELLQEVIFCKKHAVKADRKKLLTSNRSKRNTVYLSSDDGKYEYKLFLRQSDEFIEDFSVGLIWTNPAQYIDIPKNSVILMRCQGPHDGKEPIGTTVHHDYHIHNITLEDFQQKRYQKPSGRFTTEAFASFAQAILYMINTCKISNLEELIELPEEVTQTSLFEGD